MTEGKLCLLARTISDGLGERLGERRAARHNAAPRVRCVQCEIRLPRELSGAGPDVQGLSTR